jgi:hypothetical protein
MCINYENELEEPVVYPICNEWYELQDSKQSKYNALALICPDYYDAEDPDLEDIFSEYLQNLKTTKKEAVKKEKHYIIQY